MRKILLSLAIAFITLPVSGIAATPAPDWKQTLRERLPLYGHRNWIVIADSAYPAQTSSGIETIVSNATQIEVLKQVLADIAGSKHVRPIVYLDRELQFLDDKAAPGVAAYHKQLTPLLGKQEQHTLLHEQIISKLDQVSHDFRVLIIKTNMTIPYTSVFLELRASYWSDANESKLRTAMK